MSTAVTIPGETQANVRVNLSMAPEMSQTTTTFLAGFDKVKNYLSDKPLKRPRRTAPVPQISNAHLKRLAAAHPPPQEWLNGDEACPF